MPAPSDSLPEFLARLRRSQEVPNADAVREFRGLLRGRGWQTPEQLIALRPAWTEPFIRAVALQSRECVVCAPSAYRLHLNP